MILQHWLEYVSRRNPVFFLKCEKAESYGQWRWKGCSPLQQNLPAADFRVTAAGYRRWLPHVLAHVVRS